MFPDNLKKHKISKNIFPILYPQSFHHFVSKNPTEELRKVNKFAKNANELLVEGEISKNAIVKRYTPCK